MTYAEIFHLTKDKSELLTSRLKECNLLRNGVKITLYRNGGECAQGRKSVDWKRSKWKQRR